MSIDLLSGITIGSDDDTLSMYPVNFFVIPIKTGVANYYLRQAYGIRNLSTHVYGIDRGGINWENKLYRVLGSNLVLVDENGGITSLGDVGNNGAPVSMTYSFDRLAIASNNNLFYYDGVSLTQVTDPDLGVALDVLWIDGYFMTTDGEHLVVTELNNPTIVDPLKYGSSEVDPDPVVALLKWNNEAYAINRYTIEVFDNAGGSGFPFGRINGAQAQVGSVGTHACCIFNDGVGLLGSGRNAPLGVYWSVRGDYAKLSTNTIDKLLMQIPESELSKIVLESVQYKSNIFLLVHLPFGTFVYDHGASSVLNTPIWTLLETNSFTDNPSQRFYHGRFFVWCYNKYICASKTESKLGYWDENIATHFEHVTEWRLYTKALYNASKGGCVHSIQLIGFFKNLIDAIPGTVSDTYVGDTIYTSYSDDSRNFSQEKPSYTGRKNQIDKRIEWRQNGRIRRTRVQKFRGSCKSISSIYAIEMEVEPLYV